MIEAGLNENQKVIKVGDPNCYIFMHIDMTGNNRKTTLISLALVDNNGRSFLGEFNDFSEKQFEKLTEYDKSGTEMITGRKFFNNDNIENVTTGKDWYVYGKRKDISKAILDWFEYYKNNGKTIQLVGDCPSYEFVMFLDLISDTNHVNSSDCVPFISPVVYDINSLIASNIVVTKKDNNMKWEDYVKNFVPIYDSLKFERESLFKDLSEEDDWTPALKEAFIVRHIFKKLNGPY